MSNNPETAQDIMYFEKMCVGAEGIIEKSSRPWKWAVVCLVLAVAICITGWVISSFRYMETIDKLSDQIVEQRLP